jgi:transposase
MLRLEIVKRGDGQKGFVVLPRRWVVERTFSWFGRNRRIAKDYENLGLTLAAFVTLACGKRAACKAFHRFGNKRARALGPPVLR